MHNLPQGSAELIRSTKGGGFYNADHLQTLREKRRDIKKDREAPYKTKLKGLVCNLKGTDKPLILCAKCIGASISVRGTTVSVTVLYAIEF